MDHNTKQETYAQHHNSSQDRQQNARTKTHPLDPGENTFPRLRRRNVCRFNQRVVFVRQKLRQKDPELEQPNRTDDEFRPNGRIANVENKEIRDEHNTENTYRKCIAYVRLWNDIDLSASGVASKSGKRIVAVPTMRDHMHF
jgi:hypothetical protein